MYALLQLARDDEARRELEAALKVQGFSERFVAFYAMAAMEARYAVERGNWRDAMALNVRPSKYPFVDAITRFSRGLGAARSNDVAAAQKEAEALAALHKALQDAKNSYSANEVEVQRPATAGWIALAQKNNDDALSHARRRRSRGSQREAHRYARTGAAGPRAARRHADADGAACAGIEGVRSPRRSANRIAFAGCTARRLRRRGRRSREGVAAFRTAGGDDQGCRHFPAGNDAGQGGVASR